MSTPELTTFTPERPDIGPQPVALHAAIEYVEREPLVADEPVIAAPEAFDTDLLAVDDNRGNNAPNVPVPLLMAVVITNVEPSETQAPIDVAPETPPAVRIAEPSDEPPEQSPAEPHEPPVNPPPPPVVPMPAAASGDEGDDGSREPINHPDTDPLPTPEGRSEESAVAATAEASDPVGTAQEVSEAPFEPDWPIYTVKQDLDYREEFATDFPGERDAWIPSAVRDAVSYARAHPDQPPRLLLIADSPDFNPEFTHDGRVSIPRAENTAVSPNAIVFSDDRELFYGLNETYQQLNIPLDGEVTWEGESWRAADLLDELIRHEGDHRAMAPRVDQGGQLEGHFEVHITYHSAVNRYSIEPRYVPAGLQTDDLGYALICAAPRRLSSGDKQTILARGFTSLQQLMRAAHAQSRLVPEHHRYLLDD